MDERGILTLYLALSTGQKDLALSLIEHKARVNQLDSSGSTPLHNAIVRGLLNFYHRGYIYVTFNWK